MVVLFYIAALIAIVATAMALTRTKAVHALLYLVVSLLAVAVIFYLVGAPLIAALEAIVYAGAIMTLFIFVVMMLNLGPASERQERAWLTPATWIGPSALSFILLVEFAIVFSTIDAPIEPISIAPAQVGMALFTEYLLGVQLAGMTLMAAVIGAYHLGKREQKVVHRYLEKKEKESESV